MKDGKKVINLILPENLHFLFAVMCRKERTTMRDRMLGLIQKDVEEFEAKESKKTI